MVTLVLTNCNKVGGRGIKALSNLRRLFQLNISGCIKVTNRMVQILCAKCKRLRNLDLRGCRKVTEDCVKEIKQRRRELAIIFGHLNQKPKVVVHQHSKLISTYPNRAPKTLQISGPTSSKIRKQKHAAFPKI